MADAPIITRDPPTESEHTWLREDRILPELKKALDEAIATHGDQAKAIAWDVLFHFERLLK